MFSLNAAAINICNRMAQEHVREGCPRPDVTWTGRHELKNDRLWIEVKVTEPEYRTWVTGWTDGEEQYGFMTFLLND